MTGKEMDLMKDPQTLEEANALFMQLLTVIGDRYLTIGFHQDEIKSAKARILQVREKIKEFQAAPLPVTDEIVVPEETVVYQPKPEAPPIETL